MLFNLGGYVEKVLIFVIYVMLLFDFIYVNEGVVFVIVYVIVYYVLK